MRLTGSLTSITGASDDAVAAALMILGRARLPTPTMPTSQTLPSPTTATPSATDILNGIPQDNRNGNSPTSLSNGFSASNDGDENVVTDALRAQKQRVKAQMSAPSQSQGPLSNPAKDLERNTRPVNGNGEAPSSGLVNGAVQTRKRSRSGSLIVRPVDATSSSSSTKHRGTNDPRGTLMERVKIADYTERDLLHWATIIEETAESEALQKFKADEKDFHAALRSSRHHHPLDARFPWRDLQPAPLRDPHNIVAIYGPGYAYKGGRYRGSKQAAPQQPGARHTRRVRLSRKQLEKHAEQLEELVPIRLDIEWEHADFGKIRLRDTFTWNLYERLVEPRAFAETLVEDFGLPLEKCGPLVEMVKVTMEEQIQEHYPHVFLDEGPADPQQPYDAYKDDELRITIKLNITIGQHTLVDQFEWDLNNSAEAAELFARQMSHDLSLSGEFTTAIAHSIREQCQLFTRSLYVLGYQFDGRPVTDEDLKSGFGASPMPSSFRPYQAAKEFQPYFYELNDVELEKTELSLSREERRQKRSVNRRGGPALPDIKDRQRTIRTLVVSTVIPGAAETLEGTKIFKRAPAAKPRKTYAREGGGDDDSDDLESDDSAPEEPAIPSHLLSGTARTRGMRGAATAAQAAMRGTIGRSATPESASLHYHETRTSGRKSGGKEYREESADEGPSSLIVKFRFPKDRFRRFIQDMARSKNKNLAVEGSSAQHATRRSQSATPGHGTPAPPSTTPHHVQNSHAHHNSPGQLRDGQPVNPIHPHAAQLGRIDANGPPTVENPAVCKKLCFHGFMLTLKCINSLHRLHG